MQTNSLLQPCIDTESAVREIHGKELSEYKKTPAYAAIATTVPQMF